MDNSKEIKIFVKLFGEGTDVWRPVQAKPVGNDSFKITSSNDSKKDESWEFNSGQIVNCKEKRFEDGTVKLVAIEKV